MEKTQAEPAIETLVAVLLPELPADVEDAEDFVKVGGMPGTKLNILRRLSTQSCTGNPCHLHTEAITACPIGAKDVIPTDRLQRFSLCTRRLDHCAWCSLRREQESLLDCSRPGGFAERRGVLGSSGEQTNNGFGLDDAGVGGETSRDEIIRPHRLVIILIVQTDWFTSEGDTVSAGDDENVCSRTEQYGEYRAGCLV